ncbi:MAG: F0F1 ATP synthase subunit gamma [Tolumonas sp.]|nr:F0F1 ATP synthase subunit gamma [Tolumonas sp.]
MSRRREINKKLEALSDIAGIMSAMKGLALMEIRILMDFIVCQQRMVTSIEQTAAEFFATHAALVNSSTAERMICIVIGSEQGFCGDFNETLLAEMKTISLQQTKPVCWLIVGRRLANRIDEHDPTISLLPGAIVSDEISNVLLQLTQQLNSLLAQEHIPSCGISVLYHCDTSNIIRSRHLLPLSNLPEPVKMKAYPAELNILPEELLLSLTDHYLYAVLNEVLYSSLMAENRQRQIHMDRALQ